MKPLLFSLFILITIQLSFTQTKELVLKKSFEAKENTLLNIDVDNATIVFEESTDNNVYFDYYIAFKKDSEETQNKVFKGLKATAIKENNVIKLDVKNDMFLGELHTLNVNIETYKKHIKNIFKTLKKEDSLHKTKEKVLKEIIFSLGLDTKDYFKNLKLKNPNQDFGEPAQKFKQKFVIKVPNYVKINIKALHSKINFTYNLKTVLNVNAFKTYFKFKTVEHSKNNFNLIRGILQAEKLNGGNYIIKNIGKVKLGEIVNLKLETESSKIQIGEIKENISFKDYDSKIYLYNFSKSFMKFNLKGEYSKIYFFQPNFDYDLAVYGNTTTFYMDKNKITNKNSSKNKRNKMMARKAKTKNPLGKINFEIRNSIFYFPTTFRD